MNRRAVITLVGGAVASCAFWPLASAHAQRTDRPRRVGVIMGFAEDDEVWQAYLATFRQGLQQLGWTDGRNIRFDYRFTGESAERMRTMAEEVVSPRARRDPRFHQFGGVGHAQGDAHNPDRLHLGVRSGRQRICHQPAASRRKHHRLP